MTVVCGMSALDIPCPQCRAPRDHYCSADAPRFHKDRIMQVVKLTREANEKARKAYVTKR